MKAIMGFAFFLLFLAGIALVTLKGRSMISIGGSGAELTGVTWQAVAIGEDSIPDDSGIYIQFEVDGSIKGNGGCNGFFGSLAQSDDGIGIGSLASTEMACREPVMSREMSFLESVHKMANFETTSNGMNLLAADGAVLAQFVDSSEN
jgi:heat shock protein HslJ